MQRVAVLGSGGAGKSVLAAAIAERTALPVVHLDTVYWKPGWTKPSRAEFDAKLDAAVAGEAGSWTATSSGTTRQIRASTASTPSSSSTCRGASACGGSSGGASGRHAGPGATSPKAAPRRSTSSSCAGSGAIRRTTGRRARTRRRPRSGGRCSSTPLAGRREPLSELALACRQQAGLRAGRGGLRPRAGRPALPASATSTRTSASAPAPGQTTAARTPATTSPSSPPPATAPGRAGPSGRAPSQSSSPGEDSGLTTPRSARAASGSPSAPSASARARAGGPRAATGRRRRDGEAAAPSPRPRASIRSISARQIGSASACRLLASRTASCRGGSSARRRPAARELEAPRPLRRAATSRSRRRPACTAPRGRPRAGSAARVGRPRQQAAVAEERGRLVERLERAVGREPALERAPLLELAELGTAPYTRPSVATAAIVTIGNELALRRRREHERLVAREAARGSSASRCG